MWKRENRTFGMPRCAGGDPPCPQYLRQIRQAVIPTLSVNNREEQTGLIHSLFTGEISRGLGILPAKYGDVKVL